MAELKVDGIGETSGISTIKVPDFPGNSHKSKEVARIRLKPKAVAKGVKKTDPKEQFSEIFRGSIKDARSTIWQDQIKPGLIDLAAEAFYTLIDYIFYQGSRRSRRYSGGAVVRTDYRTASRSSNRSKTANERYYDTSDRSKPKWNEVVVDGTQKDAQLVWDILVEKLQDNQEVSVGDLFSAVGWDTAYTDFDMGWKSLDGCTITKTRDGWWFDMTRPRKLD